MITDPVPKGVAVNLPYNERYHYVAFKANDPEKVSLITKTSCFKILSLFRWVKLFSMTDGHFS